MNPWAVVILAIGAVMIIAGYKGTQGQLLSAITGKPAAAAQQTGNYGGTGPSVATPQLRPDPQHMSTGQEI